MTESVRIRRTTRIFPPWACRPLLNLAGSGFLTLAVFLAHADHASAQVQPARPPRATGTSGEALAPRVIPGPWSRRSLVRKGDPAPGSGGQFQEFYEAYPLDSDHLVFWARYGPSQLDRGIYAWKSGVLKAVFMPSGKGWERSVGTWPGKGVVYLARAREWSSILVWDGERLTRLLGRGDPWPHRDTTYSLDTATLWASSWVERSAVIEITAKAPRPLKAWLLHDRAGLKILFAVGDSLPGQPGTRVKDFQVQGLSAGAVIGKLDLEGEKARTLLVAVQPDQLEPLLELGGKDLSDPSKSLRDAFPIPSTDPGLLALHGTRVWGSGKTEDLLMIRRGGSLKTAYEGSTCLEVDPRLQAWKDSQYDWPKYSLRGGSFLGGSRPDYVFFAQFSRPAGMRAEPGALLLLTEHIGKVLLHDGNKVRSLGELGIAAGNAPVRFKPYDGEVPGLLGMLGGLGFVFVAEDGPSVKATQVPEFAMEDGSRISLERIPRGVHSGQAFGVDSDGVFLLEKKRP